MAKKDVQIFKRCVHATRHTSEVEKDVEAESDTGPLPDRLIDPGGYEPVLPATEEHTAAELTETKSQSMKSQEGWLLCKLIIPLLANFLSVP